MTTSTEGLALAELVFYALVSLPAFYCIVAHGKHGLMGWIYVVAMCGLRVAGNALTYHSLSTTGKANVVASILNGIGLSPLLLAALGLFREANYSVQRMLPVFLGNLGVLVTHLVVGAGIALAAASSRGKAVLLDVGLIIFGTGWFMVLGLTVLSYKAAAHRRRAEDEKKLLYAIMAALPLIGIRIVYAIAAAFAHSSASGGSLPLRVIFETLPEFLVMIIYVSVGIATRALARDRQEMKTDPA